MIKPLTVKKSGGSKTPQWNQASSSIQVSSTASGASGSQFNDWNDVRSIRTAAIMAKVEKNTTITDKVIFTVGLSNNKSFRVSDDGSRFIFTQGGLYRIVFRGKTNAVGKIILNRTPPVNQEQLAFAKLTFGGDIREVSTMLPFQVGSELSIEFFPNNNGKGNVLEAGSQIEIYRVDDL